MRAEPQAGAAAAAGAWRLFTIVELPRPKIENNVDDAIHTWEARNRPSRRRRTKHSWSTLPWCALPPCHTAWNEEISFEQQKVIMKKPKQNGIELHLEQELNESFEHFHKCNSKFLFLKKIEKTPPRKRELCFSWLGERSFGGRRKAASGVLEAIGGSPFFWKARAHHLMRSCWPPVVLRYPWDHGLMALS